ncbi:glycosyltransferase [Baaleninema sp.]|uniref:glycosyltransferase n=1 Tax=Baaleninema sp. TaxID=3101197 RepID=UPI003D0040ED
MNVAIITSGFLPVIDGVSISQIHRLHHLSQQGHRVLLLHPHYPQGNDASTLQLPGVTCVPLPSISFLGVEGERNVTPAANGVLNRVLGEFQPDIIHVDEPERLWLGFLRYPALRFARRHHIPCTAFFHSNLIEYLEDYFDIPRPILRGIQYLLTANLPRIYNRYDLTLTASSITAETLHNRGIKNIVCDDFLGFDLDRFQPQKLRNPNFFSHRYGLPKLENHLKIAFLGRLTPDKGWSFFLKVLPQLSQILDLNRIVFLIGGDGELRDPIREKFAQFTPHFYQLGRLSPEAVPAFLANSDIYLTTSTKETRGLTVIEALACELPVLAPNAGGIPDTIRDGWNGLLFKPGDRADFLTKFQQLSNNVELRKSLGQRGRKSVETLTWENAVTKLVNLWRKLQ